MKLAYEHDMSQPLGASYIPGNVVREEHTSASGGTPSTGLQELRAVANRSGQDQAMLHYGVKRAALGPKTNVDDGPLRKPAPVRIPDAGTPYATSGAQYGTELNRA